MKQKKPELNEKQMLHLLYELELMPEPGRLGGGPSPTPQYLADQFNPIPIGEGQIIPTYYYCPPPKIVSPSSITELELMMVLVKGQGVKNMRRLVNSVTLVNPF